MFCAQAHTEDWRLLSMALAIGRLDLAIAGLGGAGKTRAAALIILALASIDPEVRIAVVSKENAARSTAHLITAFAPVRK